MAFLLHMNKEKVENWTLYRTDNKKIIYMILECIYNNKFDLHVQ